MMPPPAPESIEFSFNNQRFTLPVVEGTQGERRDRYHRDPADFQDPDPGRHVLPHLQPNSRFNRTPAPSVTG